MQSSRNPIVMPAAHFGEMKNHGRVKPGHDNRQFLLS